MRVGSVVINVADVDRAAEFWGPALGYVRRNAALDDETFVVLCKPERDWVNVSLQRTAEPKTAVNRLHLDLYAEDQAAEVARLEGLGAKRVEPWPYDADADYIVMADPDGNEFCVIQMPRPA